MMSRQFRPGKIKGKDYTISWRVIIVEGRNWTIRKKMEKC